MSYIHAETFGQGPPLVMIHGWAMHSGVWRDFARRLALHYRVICVDLPGHGRSEALEAFKLENIAETVLAAIPQRRFFLLGWSLGATVAMAMTSRAPERVERLFVLAGNPLFVQTGDWPGVKAETLDAFAELLQTDVQQTLLRFLALQVNGLAHGKTLLQSLRWALLECPPPAAEVLRAGLDVLKNTDLRAFMRENPVSTSMILGEKDTLIPVGCGAAVQGLNPEVKLQILSSAGHAPFLSHPQQLVSAVTGVS
ncbi:pimeloyl-ACP methyl ester esterase BioH [Methylomonas sp. SURF-2]|uniref:Pimeloyl-[acyl-carrier protein] methyl ester esterase n=1 Tax=Methylomonas subterranea TaxID=2952225 RepID=A0ABT1TJK9_9GAMM|nr:pimeloyl-ACP methyl ester esterase BioH [Methylomonas sp. SURF-2]MCQ8105667.1 pimeloyl-ACP methyl ester esterase BioH [Methylomonas sp. SURF-2]